MTGKWKKSSGAYALMPFICASGALNKQSSLLPRHLYQNRQSMQALASKVLCVGKAFSLFIFSVFTMIERMMLAWYIVLAYKLYISI
jgi:hypothetical protein